MYSLLCFVLVLVSAMHRGFSWLMHSGITPGSAQGTIWDAGNRTRVGRVQGKHPPLCTIAPAPQLEIFLVTPSNAKGLLLALHSGITAGGAWGTIWDAGD